MSIKIGVRFSFLICRDTYNLFSGIGIECRIFLITPVIFLEKQNKVTDNEKNEKKLKKRGQNPFLFNRE